MEYLSIAGLRVDGRRPNEVRRVRCELGVLKDCDGSANLEQGNTKVAVSVFGPREVVFRSKALHDRAIINCSILTAPFSGSERKRRRPGDRRLLTMAREIENLFGAVVQTHLFARSQIDIVVNVLQTDGGLLSTAINAVNLALIDAGVPMDDFVMSATVGYLSETALLDVNQLEESGNAPKLTLAVIPKTSQILSVEMVSKIPIDVFDSMTELALMGCQQLLAILDSAVRERTASLLEARGALAA